MATPRACSGNNGGAMGTASARTAAVRVRIRGRVQGIFFRGWTVASARALGLNGWVRNRVDGSVEAQFEGPAGAVEDMIGRCAEGPPMARVASVERLPAEKDGSADFHERPTV